MPVKLVTRYLYRELFIPFFLGLVLFTGIFLLQRLFELTELIVSRGLPVFEVVLLVFSGVPQTLFITAPMAAILAVLMAYGRLAADNELIALRVGGYSLFSLVYPVLIAALLFTGGLITLRQYGLPVLSRYRNEMLKDISFPAPEQLMAADSYLELGPYTIFARQVKGAKIGGVYLEDRSGKNLVIIYAESGRWIKSGKRKYKLFLREGTMHQKVADGGYRVLRFNRQQMEMKLGRMSKGIKSDRELTVSIASLYQQMAEAGKHMLAEKENEKMRRNYRKKVLAFHRALSIPAATFFLVLVAAPLGMFAQQSGKSIGLALSLGLIFFYYLISMLMEPLAIRGWVPAGLALWLPNFLFGGTGIIMLVKLWRQGR